MFVWILLFLIVLAVSLILAIKSMDDYCALPLNFGLNYSLFLVKKPEGLTPELLQNLYDKIFPDKLIISLERLFKGSKKALIIYGPVPILQQFSVQLDLLELEEYSQKINPPYLAWGVGKRKAEEPLVIPEPLFSKLPDIAENEQFWWQVVLQPKSQNYFQGVLRAVVLTGNKTEAKILQDKLVGTGAKDGLLMLPLPDPVEQLVKFYQERSLSSRDAKKGNAVILTSGNIPALLGLN